MPLETISFWIPSRCLSLIASSSFDRSDSLSFSSRATFSASTTGFLGPGFFGVTAPKAARSISSSS